MIIVRRELPEPKMALGGAMLMTSFTRFITSMATFDTEMVPFRPFGRWGVATIVETRVLHEAARMGQSPDGDEPRHGGSRVNRVA